MTDREPMTPHYAGAIAVKPQTGMAVGALICGLLSFLIPLLGVVAIILGIVALIRAKRDPSRFGGKGMAIGGIITGFLFDFVVRPLLLIAILIPAFGAARTEAKRVMCMANLRIIGASLDVYFDETGVRAPNLASLAEYGVRVDQLRCPSAEGDDDGAYIYIPIPTPLPAKFDASRFVAAYEPPGRHRNGANALFADGHSEYYEEYAALKRLVDESLNIASATKTGN